MTYHVDPLRRTAKTYIIMYNACIASLFMRHNKPIVLRPPRCHCCGHCFSSFTIVVRGQSDGKSVGINIGGDGGSDGVIWECFMVVVSAVMVEMVESDKKLTITFNFVY